MDLDDNMLDWRSLIFQTLAGFRDLVVSECTSLALAALLHVLDIFNGGGSLFVFPGLSLSFCWPSHRQLNVKGTRPVNECMSSTCVASYHYC